MSGQWSVLECDTGFLMACHFFICFPRDFDSLHRNDGWWIHMGHSGGPVRATLRSVVVTDSERPRGTGVQFLAVLFRLRFAQIHQRRRVSFGVLRSEQVWSLLWWRFSPFNWQRRKCDGSREEQMWNVVAMATKTMEVMFDCSVGGSLPVIFSYYTEFQPKEKRGSMISLLATFWMCGNIVAAGVCDHSFFFLVFSNWHF